MLILLLLLAQESTIPPQGPVLKFHHATKTDPNSRDVLEKQSCQSLELRLILREYAVLAHEGHRAVARIGDRLGSEGMTILAMVDGQILLQGTNGYALIQGSGSSTVLETIPRTAMTPLLQKWQASLRETSDQ